MPTISSCKIRVSYQIHKRIIKLSCLLVLTIISRFTLTRTFVLETLSFGTFGNQTGPDRTRLLLKRHLIGEFYFLGTLERRIGLDVCWILNYGFQTLYIKVRVRIPERWSIYIINSVDKTKFLYTTSPPTQHHSFFRKYPFSS